MVDPPRGSGFETKMFRWATEAKEYADKCPPPTRIVDLDPTPKINDLLVERKKTHGLYDDDAACAMALVDVMDGHATAVLSHVQRHSAIMICFKLARILTGDPDFRDHWDDIAGYAKLVSDRCSK